MLIALFLFVFVHFFHFTTIPLFGLIYFIKSQQNILKFVSVILQNVKIFKRFEYFSRKTLETIEFSRRNVEDSD